MNNFRNEFHIPKIEGKESIYLCGNSLGPLPKLANAYVNDMMKDWEEYGVLGHTSGSSPWLPYHEFVTPGLAKIVGANTCEVVAMNTLSANIHFLMVSFYRPTQKKYKILYESQAFPSDTYALQSQANFHNFPDALIPLTPREGEHTLRPEDILQKIKEHKNELALIFFGGVNYLTGQVFPMEEIGKLAKEFNIPFGLDLAHAVGNIPLELHKWNVDFAMWCHYKYLNSGPGCVGGAYVHEKHHNENLPKFHGWWGHNKETRFQMDKTFVPIQSVESWQLSNPPILPLACLRASLEIFNKTSMDELRKKSLELTQYLQDQLEKEYPQVQLLTPKDPEQRGAQLSLLFPGLTENTSEILRQKGIICDYRNPQTLRIAPAPLFNTHKDIDQLIVVLKDCLDL